MDVAAKKNLQQLGDVQPFVEFRPQRMEAVLKAKVAQIG